MDLCSINSVPHDIKPSFSRHHTKHRGHCIHHVVKVTFLVAPLAAVVNTVPLGFDLFHCVVGHILDITIVKLAFEEAHSLNTENHQQQLRNQHQVDYAWDGLDQGYRLDLQAEVPLEKPQRPQHSKHAENFENVEVFCT